MESKKRILVAPLNWGLGHATRCVPIINTLIKHGFEPVIASDGPALLILQKEFPELIALTLPSYNISYSKKASHFKFKILKDSPNIIKAIKRERKAVESIIKDYDISGIISDNRFGVRHKHVPSVFITHQLHVLSGMTSWLSSKLHQRLISKFNVCWVPDTNDSNNLSGKLGHLENTQLNIKYIGPLSRFKKQKINTAYDLMVLLSGPEPQRRFLETLLFNELTAFKGNILFVKGVIEDQQHCTQRDHFTIYNFMQSQDLEIAINQSKLVLSRSGYTTLMDLAKLEKKAFFIPTPGQYEQEYLAERLNALNIAPYCKQDQFNIELLAKTEAYKGFSKVTKAVSFDDLFSLF